MSMPVSYTRLCGYSSGVPYCGVCCPCCVCATVQIIGDVPAPVTDSDVKRFYQYIFSLGPQ